MALLERWRSDRLRVYRPRQQLARAKRPAMPPATTETLEFIDGAGLHALIASARHARQHGRLLEVRRPLPRSLGRLVALTGVGTTLGL